MQNYNKKPLTEPIKMEVNQPFQAAVYRGKVMHKRLFPTIHKLNYRVFYLYMPLDKVENLAEETRFFSCNRFNLFSFYDRDHGARDGSAIRPWINKALEQKGMSDLIGHKIMVLCYPRILGYVFNPLTIYYIYDKGDQLAAILHEVKNTFGEQHGYLLPVKRDERGLIVQDCEKVFHVSPFMETEGHYDFTLNEPDQKLLVHINYAVDKRDKLVAKLTGERSAFGAKNLISCFFSYPLMTLKVILGIHYEALHIWRKKIPFVKKPNPPDRDVT